MQPTVAILPPPMVELRNLAKRYGTGDTALTALAEVTLTIPTGRFIALLGPSGSGKSTLLNLLGAVDRPSSGVIHIGGTNLSTLSDKQLALFRRRHLGYVFQSFHLVPSLNVFDNVAVPWVLDRAMNGDRREQVMTLLGRLGIADKSKRYPDELSGGQQQRVALARALIHRPRLVLADEPTGNLDAKTGRITLDLIVELHREMGVTVVMATHSDEAAACCDARIHLLDGRVDRIDGVLDAAFVGARA